MTVAGRPHRVTGRSARRIAPSPEWPTDGRARGVGRRTSHNKSKMCEVRQCDASMFMISIDKLSAQFSGDEKY